MDFELSPELTRYQESIRTWGRDAARRYARQADEDHALPAEQYAVLDTCPVPLDRIDPSAMVKPIPEFADPTLIRDTAIIEAVMYCDVWLFEAMNKAIGHFIVKMVGTPDQVARWHDPIAAPGGGCAALAMSEPGAGSDNGNIATTAKKFGDSWVLNGSKMYCSRGAEADYIVVMATIDRSLKHAGIRAFVVEKNTPGLIITRANEAKLGLRSWVTTAFTLENCVIPLDHQLGWDGEEAADAGKTLAKALGSFNYTRPLVSVQTMAIARAAYDVTFEHLQSVRSEFTPARWERIRQELAAMDRAIRRGRALGYRAIWMQTAQVPARLEAAVTKCYGPVMAERIILKCMQILGPDGGSEAMLLEKWYRDIKIFDIFEGTNQIMHNIIAGYVIGPASRN